MSNSSHRCLASRLACNFFASFFRKQESHSGPQAERVQTTQLGIEAGLLRLSAWNPDAVSHALGVY